jgi:hypothetical protein
VNGWDPAALELISLLVRSARGPRREGLFALWLTLRVAQDLQLEPPLMERNVRRRITSLESRMSSLTVPAPLRRALTAALHQLRDATRESVPGILNGLVAPTREAAGQEAAEAVRKAERTARQALLPLGR